MELKSKKDVKINATILKLSQAEFESRKPLYCIVSDGSIQIHPEWADYIKEHYQTLQNWAFAEWVNYMQRRNPNISDVASRLLPPQIE